MNTPPPFKGKFTECNNTAFMPLDTKESTELETSVKAKIWAITFCLGSDLEVTWK